MKIFKAIFLLAGIATGTSLTVLAQPKAGSKTDVAIFSYVEQMPTFNGSVNQYMSHNIQFPEEARLAGVSGLVGIKFVIDEWGNVTDAAVAKSMHPALDSEALRVVRAMPKWKPGMQGGKPVKVDFRMPVRFTLSDPAPDSAVASAPVNTTLLVPELPLAFADEMPRFDGQLSSYLQQHLIYPPEARKAGTKGLVSVTFVVENDGRITGARISKSVSPALDAEALRVISEMPRWIAGKQGGKPAAVYQVVEVSFGLK